MYETKHNPIPKFVQYFKFDVEPLLKTDLTKDYKKRQ